MKRLAFAATIACLWGCALPGTGWADMITLSHTWTGTESVQGTERLFRNGTASVAGTQKPFPGTVAANPTLFV
jgi:hypothetical protein